MAIKSEQANTQKKKTKWLEAYRQYGIITAACRASKVGRTTVYEWIASDPEFAQAKQQAEEEAIELLEGEARRRAYEGTLKPVYFKGEQCGEIREYSDTLMMFILKAKKPEYRDRVQQEISGPDGKPVSAEVNINIKVVD